MAGLKNIMIHILKNGIKYFRDTKHLLLAIVITGLVLRVMFIIMFPDIGEGALMDSQRYQKTAVHILQGRGFCEYIRRPSAFAPPLYPTFLAGIFAVFGKNILIVKLIQAFLSASTIIIVFKIGKLLFNEKTGLIGAGIAAVFPELIVIPAYLYTETLYMVFSTTAFYFMIKGYKQKFSLWLWVWSGLLLGLGLLTRHILIMFPVFIVITFYVFKSMRTNLKGTIVMAVVCYAVVSPWIIRNYIQFHEFIPIARGARSGLWVGSYLPYNGEFRYSETMERIVKEAGSVDNLVQRDNVLFSKAMQTIIQHPWTYFSLSAKKFFLYYFKAYRNIPNGRPRSTNFMIFFTLTASYYLMLFFTAIGVVISRKEWRQYIIIFTLFLYSGVIHSLTVAVPRYRMPLYPFLAVLSAFGVYKVIRFKREHIKV